MFICEILLFDRYFPQFCKSDMSKYGYLEVFQRVPSTSRYRESTVLVLNNQAPLFTHLSQSHCCLYTVYALLETTNGQTRLSTLMHRLI